MEEQEIVVRPLSPELCGDWLRYFETMAFQDHGDWSFCYCLEGHLSPKTQEEWINPAERREMAIELIHAGKMQGYLAYAGSTVVGWCNTNDRENYRYLTDMFQQIGYQPDGTKVKVIFCFLIAPDYRGRGVAQRLLNRVCEDALRDGYSSVEVYPFADEAFEFQYHGPVRLYEKSGFAQASDLNYVKVMRKRLI